ncbi:MAG: sulfite exporter TauE/SafE family protein [Actinomycetota bacterium]|nr:sulfite exporter TauE/SafE family protein [Actinomycetota bacterium]
MTAPELAALGGWCFLVALGGGMAGLVLGNIRLPAVLLVAASPAAGAGANIAISGVAATAAGAAHIRAGRINWRLFGCMAPPSMVGAIVGGYLSGLLAEDLLLAGIGLALLYFGIDLLRPKGEPPPPSDGRALDVRAAVISGALIGLLGGLVGLILGALRMPALLRYVGEEPARAVGTNLAVGVCVGVAGLVGHLPGGVDWEVFAVGAAASVPGALLGARLTGRLSERQLLRAIGAVLVVAALGTLVQAAS